MQCISRLIVTVIISALALGAAADDDRPPSWAAIWHSWSAPEQVRFLEGFEIGYQRGLSSARPIVIDAELRTMFNAALAQQRRLIDHFYSDPANRLISIEDALVLGLARYKGEDITERLNDYRKRAHEVHGP